MVRILNVISPLRKYNYTQNLNYIQTQQLNLPQHQNIYGNNIPIHLHVLPINNIQSYIALQQIPSQSISQSFINIQHLPEQQYHLQHMTLQNIYNQPINKQYMYIPQILKHHIPQQHIYKQHIAEQQIHENYNKETQNNRDQLFIVENPNIYQNYILIHDKAFPMNIQQSYIPQEQIPSRNLPYTTEQQINISDISQQDIYRQPEYVQYMHNPHILQNHIPQQHIHEQNIAVLQNHESYINENTNNQHLIPKTNDIHKDKNIISSNDLLGENFKILKPGILPLTTPDISNMTLISEPLNQKPGIYKMTESDIHLQLRIMRNVELKNNKFPLNLPKDSHFERNWIYGRKFIQRFINAIENKEYFMNEKNTQENIFIKCIINLCVKNPTYRYFKIDKLRQCCNIPKSLDISFCKIYTSHLAKIQTNIWDIIRLKYKDTQF